MLTLSTVVLASTLALVPANGRNAPTKEVGGGVAGAVCACTGDINASGTVDASDLALLLGGWGGSGAGDLDGNGSTDAADLALLLGAWGPCASAPANDLCQNSIEIGEGPTAFCTLGANTDGPAYAAGSSCVEFGYANVYGDVWYTYSPLGDGDLTLSTCGSDFDTRLAVYGTVFPGTIGCPGGQISLVGLLGCNDDDAACGFASKLTVPVKAGHQYKIRVGGFNGFTGTGVLSLSFLSAGSSCLHAIQLNDVDGLTVYGTTVDNDAGADLSPCGTNDTVGEWYSFESTCGGPNATMTISTCNDGTDFDTVVSVWKQGLNGCTSQFIDCNDDTNTATCQLNGFPRKSRVTFYTEPGAIYMVRVAGYQGAKGHFGLSFTADNCNN